MKKIPDGFTITLKGTCDNFTLDPVKNVKATAPEGEPSVASVFQEGLQRFHERLKINWKSSNYDLDLYQRVYQEQQKGKFDILHFPIGNGQIGLK